MRAFSRLGIAFAFLGATVAPLSVSACPEKASEPATSCCCCVEEAPSPCPCEAPCVVERTLPSGTLPAATPALDLNPLPFLLPVSLIHSEAPSASSIEVLRIEPGWDPGSPGFILPLRL